MLKIGEFSRLSQVTVKTLHHYDEIGLLVPDHIDQFTNHRHYALDQLPQIHRIMALKAMGLSLEQIRSMLNECLNAQQIRGMLRLKQGELQQRIGEEQAQLAQVAFRLRMLEMEEKMPELEVMVKEVAPMRALTARLSFTRDQVEAVNRQTMQALAEHDVKLVGPETEIRHAEELQDMFADVEVALPVDDRQAEDVPLGPWGTLKVGTVPGLEKAATYMHEGAHTRPIAEELLVLQRWVVANGYKLGPTTRFVHHRGWMSRADPKDWITEIQQEILPG